MKDSQMVMTTENLRAVAEVLTDMTHNSAPHSLPAQDGIVVYLRSAHIH